MTKIKKSIISTVIVFLCGILFTYVGFFEGKDIAIAVSKPKGATIFSVSEVAILGCTYFPIIIGVSLIMLSILFSAILFKNWIEKSK
jgi:hypothetical protein